jgi:hypothetical protein
MIESLLWLLLTLLRDGIFYWTGKVVIAVVTLGRWQVSFGEAGFRWWVRKPNGKLFLGADAAALIGLLFWVATAVVLIAK